MKKRWIGWILLCLIAFWILPLLPARAGVIGASCGMSVKWEFYENGMLRIWGVGDMYDNEYDNPYTPGYLTYKEKILCVEIEDGVTSVGSRAFWGCENLTAVTLGRDIQKINWGAFRECTKLRSINIPNKVREIGDTAFFECSGLQNITLPYGVTMIGCDAFLGCSNLQNVILPETISGELDAVFSDCTNLETINIPEGVTKLRYTFNNCRSLKKIKIPSSVEKLELGVFDNCTSLIQIDVAEGNTAYYSIDGVMFQRNPNRLLWYPIGRTDTIYRIPDGTEVIGNNLNGKGFCGSVNIEKVILPNSLTTFSIFYALEECPSLSAIDVDKENPTYCSEDGVLYNKEKTELILYPWAKKKQCYVVPDGVTKIGDDAFHNCDAIETVILPNSLTEIGYSAFQRCISIKEFVLPEHVSVIKREAFADCNSLTSFYFPANAEIYGSILEGCGNLKTVYLPENVLIPSNVFTACYQLTDVYYGGTEAQWKEMAENSWDGEIHVYQAAIHYNYVPPAVSACMKGDRFTLSADFHDATVNGNLFILIDGQQGSTFGIANVEQGKSEVNVPLPVAAKARIAKIFLWDDNLRPLREAESVIVQ